MLGRKRRVHCRYLSERIAAVASSLCLVFLGGRLAFGLPARNETAAQYVDSSCRFAKAALDPHLPCLNDTANGLGMPTDRQALWSLVRTACVPASYFGLAFACVKSGSSQRLCRDSVSLARTTGFHRNAYHQSGGD